MCDSQRKRMVLLFGGPSLLYHLLAPNQGGKQLQSSYPKCCSTFTTVSAFQYFFFPSRKCSHIFHLSSFWWGGWWCQISGAQRPPSGQFLCRQGNWWDRGSASREYSQNIGWYSWTYGYIVPVNIFLPSFEYWVGQKLWIFLEISDAPSDKTDSTSINSWKTK